MKMRCWRRRTVCSTRSQLIWSQSRADRAPFASVSCLTVNTPFAHAPRLWQASSLLRQWWNSAPSGDGRELPPYLRHYPEPWLGPLSFAVRHSPVVSPCKVETVGAFAAAHRNKESDSMSQFRWHHTRKRRTLLLRPAGLLFAVDDPMRRSHHPRACAPPRQQCCEVKIDGLMQFAFADPLHLPTMGDESLLFVGPTAAGFPPFGRPRVGHSGERRFGRGEATSDSTAISFVSYFSFASKSKTSKVDSYLVALTILCRVSRRF